jgi:glycosyltransferase involved in cell wall biosynthesis
LRILTVSHFFESHGGGIERVAGQLCREFAGLGASPAWVASAGDPLPARSIEAVPIPCLDPTEKLTGLPMPIPGIRGVRTLAREIRRSDAVVVHDALYVTSILAMLIAKAQSKRVTLVQHIAAIPFSSAALWALMRIANALITRPMLWAADRRVFISATVRRDLLGTRSNSGELLFNGVEEAIFHPAKEPRASSPRSRSRELLFVGRYVEKKGLRVVRQLAASRPDLSFTLAGEGPIRPSEWGLANVRDLGPQDQQTLAELYRSADLLILPSVGEGYPLVIQEAMACGLPVICGAPADRADPDATQWLRGVEIDLSDVDVSARRCAEAIDSFSLSAAERAKMSRYARSRYSWGAMAEKLMATAQ